MTVSKRSVRAAGVIAVLLAVGVGVSGADTAGDWVTGDLHVHTTYSHDTWDPINDDEESEPYTLGHSVEQQFLQASLRGLDFIAITDHNDIRAHDDEGFGTHGVLGLYGYENSLRGHAQMLGARALYDAGDRTAGAITTMADALRNDGGLFQINHPAGGSVQWPVDADWSYGHQVVPDAVEVWNIQSIWQAPAFSSNSIDDAIRFWEGFLNLGHKIPATGGSDNHWVATNQAQGVGQPTTWIYASELSEAAILEGIRAGRTFITWQPPAYRPPKVYLEADADRDGVYEAMVGDVITPTAVPIFRARVIDAPPGSFVAVYTSEGYEGMTPVLAEEVRIGVPPSAAWVRVEVIIPAEDAEAASPVRAACDEQLGTQTTYCRNRLVRVAMTSPIYIDAR